MKNVSDILILFVDDESDTISGLKRFFHKSPFRKAFAGSGSEALHILEQEKADILVTDVLMPDMGGLELMHRAKIRHPGLVCMLITGSNDVEQIINSAGPGNIYSYITKPIEPDSFRKNIESAVDHCRYPHGV
jgi:phosphoserine phosphatase RsbU/P